MSCGSPEPRPPAHAVSKTSVEGGDFGWLRYLPLTDGKPEGSRYRLSFSRTLTHSCCCCCCNVLVQLLGTAITMATAKGQLASGVRRGSGHLEPWPWCPLTILDGVSSLAASGSHQPLTVGWRESPPNRPEWPCPSPCILPPKCCCPEGLGSSAQEGLEAPLCGREQLSSHCSVLQILIIS